MVRSRSTALAALLAAFGLLMRGCADVSGLSACSDGRCAALSTDGGDLDASPAEGAPPDGDGPLTGRCLWSKRFGDGDTQHGSAVAVDPSGNVWAASSFKGSLDWGGGPLVADALAGYDVAVAKLDAQGGHLWSKRLGGTGDHYATAIATNGLGDAFVAGMFTGPLDLGVGSVPAPSDGKFDSYLLRVRADTTLASADFATGAGQQMAYGLAADPSAGAVVVGGYDGTITAASATIPSTGPRSAFTLRTLSTQNWVTAGMSVGGAEVRGVAYDRDANVVVVGSFTSSLELGTQKLVGAGGQDIFVAKLDGTGAVLNARSFGNASDESGWAIAADADGSIVIVGELTGTLQFGDLSLTSAGDTDIFVVRLDTNLAPVSAFRFGGTGKERCQTVRIDGSGNLVFTGHTYGAVDFGDGLHAATGDADAFVVKLDRGGHLLWSRFFAGPGNQSAHFGGLALAPDDSVLVFGSFEGTADWGCGALTAAGATDAYLAKLAP